MDHALQLCMRNNMVEKIKNIILHDSDQLFLAHTALITRNKAYSKALTILI